MTSYVTETLSRLGRSGSLRQSLLRTGGLVAAALLCAPPAAVAEMQLSAYGGLNTNLQSTVRLRGEVSDTRTVDWDGDSFRLPPYWGVRGTYWLSPASSWGFAIDFTHTKALASIDFATDDGYDKLEFTDGNNLLTFNVLYRFGPLLGGQLIPYAGIGAGVAIPHVEVTLDGVPQRTFEYQLAGAAAQGLVGLEYKLGESWSLFSEARISYSHIGADLTNGDHLKTYLWSPQLTIGVSYRFPSQWAPVPLW